MITRDDMSNDRQQKEQRDERKGPKLKMNEGGKTCR